MNDYLLRGYIAAGSAKDRLIDGARRGARGEKGDIVQVIIIIAMFVLVCMVVGGLLTAAIKGQATKVSNCITTSNSGKCASFK